MIKGIPRKKRRSLTGKGSACRMRAAPGKTFSAQRNRAELGGLAGARRKGRLLNPGWKPERKRGEGKNLEGGKKRF